MSNFESIYNQLLLFNINNYSLRYKEILLHLPSSVLSSEKLTFSEIEIKYFWLYFDLCFEQFSVHKLGLIPDEVWDIYHGGMKAAFGRNSFRQVWFQILSVAVYPTDFVEFISGLIVAQFNQIETD